MFEAVKREVLLGSPDHSETSQETFEWRVFGMGNTAARLRPRGAARPRSPTQIASTEYNELAITGRWSSGDTGADRTPGTLSNAPVTSGHDDRGSAAVPVCYRSPVRAGYGDNFRSL